MLYTSIVSLYLVWFLHCFVPVHGRSTRHLNEYNNRSSLTRRCLQSCFLCFEPVKCQSTRHLNEYNNRSSLTRRCLQSCFLISRHQTCFEKCLGKNKEGDFTDLNAGKLRINPPHLTATFKRRKRSTEEHIPCPDETKGNNSLPTLRTPERNQYENSSKWYLNISWDSLPDATNFTGYGISYVCRPDEGPDGHYLKMQKNETFIIFNENESCWSYDMDFYFIVIGLPCLKKEVLPYNDLPWRRDSPETPYVTATPNVTEATKHPTNSDEFSTAEVLLTVITITVVLVFVISATYLYLWKRKMDKRDV